MYEFYLRNMIYIYIYIYEIDEKMMDDGKKNPKEKEK